MRRLFQITRIIGGSIVSFSLAGFIAALLVRGLIPELSGDRPLLGLIFIQATLILASMPVPYLVTVIIGEIYAVRNPFYYVVIGCLSPILLISMVCSTGCAYAPWRTTEKLIYVLVGAIASLTYWFVSGRHAGLLKRSEA